MTENWVHPDSAEIMDQTITWAPLPIVACVVHTVYHVSWYMWGFACVRVSRIVVSKSVVPFRSVSVPTSLCVSSPLPRYSMSRLGHGLLCSIHWLESLFLSFYYWLRDCTLQKANSVQVVHSIPHRTRVASSNVDQFTVDGDIISSTFLFEMKLTENEVDHPPTSPKWNEWMRVNLMAVNIMIQTRVYCSASVVQIRKYRRVRLLSRTLRKQFHNTDESLWEFKPKLLTQSHKTQAVGCALLDAQRGSSTSVNNP